VAFTMKKSSKKLKQYLRDNQRVRYPEDEARYSWLPTLLDTYHVLDTGISLELKQAELERKDKVTCKKGCSNCCVHIAVPITEPELWGISWFSSEKLTGDIRKSVANQLQHHKGIPQCPFLVDAACSIYPVRPMACRIFFTFGAICKPDEEVVNTRMHDVWTHSRDVGKLAAMTILPLFGITGKRERTIAVEEGYLYSVAKPMHELSLVSLYRQLEKPNSLIE